MDAAIAFMIGLGCAFLGVLIGGSISYRLGVKDTEARWSETVAKARGARDMAGRERETKINAALKHLDAARNSILGIHFHDPVD